MSEPHEKILDAFLDEMLTGSRPGRQPAEIVRAAQASSANPNPASLNPPSPVNPDEIAANNRPLKITGKAIEQASVAKAPQATNTRNDSIVAPTRIVSGPADMMGPGRHHDDQVVPAGNWLSIVGLAAALLLTTGVIVWFLWSGNDDGRNTEIVNQPPGNNSPNIVPSPDIVPPNDENRIANSNNKSQPVPVQPRVEDPVVPNRDPILPPSNDRTSIASRDDIPADQTALVMPPPFSRVELTQTTPLTSFEVATVSNRHLAEGWLAAGLQPAGELELGTWTTRLMTRMLGRTPTADESSELAGLFVAAKPVDQIRQDIVEWTLSDNTRQQEFAAHWGRVLAWEMLGIGSSMQTTDPDMLQTRDYLAVQIGKQNPLDETVYRMLSVVGSTDSSREDFDPAASFLVGIAKRFGKLEQASAHIASTFTGQSMQCAVCHDSGSASDGAIAGNTQQDFFEFHAFFAQMRFEATESQQFYVVNRNFLPKAAEQEVEAPVSYTAPDGTTRDALPQFGSLEPGSNGFVAKVDRRSLLADAIVESPEFRRSIVDIVWTSLLNVPLTGVDGASQSAAPEMLALRDELGTQFAANQFNVRWLVESIVLSDAFAVGVGSPTQLADNNPFLGQAPRFNQFYQRIENRRSSVGSLTILANAYSSRNTVDAQSAGLLARIDGVASAPANSSIQANLPTNENQWATSELVERQLERIAASQMAGEQKIEHLVQAALGRPALAEEVEQGMVVLKSASDQKTALQDIWWGLMNSVEYQLPVGVR